MGTVIEYCSACESEVEMRWDVKKMGYKAYCPVCGCRLMLCDECQHRVDGSFIDDCDYCSSPDTCRFNPRVETKSIELEYIKKFAAENDFGASSEPMRDQLVSLWTAFCIHRNFEADTLEYDEALSEVWTAFKARPAYPWDRESSFESAMSRYIV